MFSKKRIFSWVGIFVLSLSLFTASVPAQHVFAASKDASVTNADACKNNGISLTWIICPVLDLASGVIDGVDKLVTEALEFNTDSFFKNSSTGTTNGYKVAWNAFRLISVGVLFISGLVIVISQSLGLEILDAYTIKKTLPRLLIAAIAINISWPLMEFIVTFFNILSIDIRNILYAPFNGLANPPNAGTSLAGIVIGWAYWTNFGLLGTMSLVLSGALALLFGFAIIAIRNLALEILIITAPIAFVAYILPNTQKLWKLWYTNTLALLLMFPIVSLFVATGRVFAAVAGSATGNPLYVTLQQLLGFVAYFAPYFMIGYAFKLAGGFIGNIAGIVNDRNKGLFDRLSKGRQKNAAQRWETRVGRPMLQRRADFQRKLNDRASSSGRFGRRLYGGLAGSMGYNVEAEMSARQAAVAKEVNDQIATGRDEAIRGLTVNKKTAPSRMHNGKRQYQSLAGAWVDEAHVDEGYKRWGNDAFAQQAALSYEMRKAMTDDDVQGITNRYVDLARDGWGMNQTQASGAWIGAGFENQNQHVEYKNTSIKDFGRRGQTGTGHMELDYEKFSKEVYEKKGSYPLSQMSAHTIGQLSRAYKYGDAATKQRVQGIAETFMQRGGGGTSMYGTGDEAIPGMPGALTGAGYQTGGQGAAHVNEAIRQLAIDTGVYQTLPPPAAPNDRSAWPPPPNLPRQK